MEVKKITTGYSPRVLQLELHSEVKRFNVVVCHRRFGKTVWAINETIDRALRNPLKNPQYAYFAPFFGQAKRVAWDYLKEYTKVIPGVTVNEAELRVEIPRADRQDKVRIILLGAENPAAIRGIYLDGAILDEFAEMDPTVWSMVIRAALSDRLGWAIFLGTPKGQNHFFDVLETAKQKALGGDQSWYWRVFKASETGIIPESELEAARSVMSEEEYEQEYECSFTAALIGAYYGKEMAKAERENRICEVPHESASLTSTYWDLGIGDTTAIWFIQQVGKEYHAIDYFEDSGKDLAHYVRIIKEKQKEFGYIYDEHFLPHDAAARELGTGKSRQEVLQSLGLRSHILPKNRIEDGINAVRLVLSKMYFDKIKCARGLQALTNYSKKWDAKNKIFSSAPLHNWASHGADAFRVFAMGARDQMDDTMKQRLPRASTSSYDIFG